MTVASLHRVRIGLLLQPLPEQSEDATAASIQTQWGGTMRQRVAVRCVCTLPGWA